MRVIASLSTIPQRVSSLHLTLESLIDQTYPISEIHLNIPFFCLRTGERYEIPEEIRNIPNVKIFRTEDFGAITKVAPTFKRLFNSENTYIYQVDDDRLYPKHALDLLVQGMSINDEKKIICRFGGALNVGSDFVPWYGKGEVSLIEGYGGVLYPPMCPKLDFFRILDEVKEIEYIRKSDDVFLSMYFKHIGIPIYMYNPITSQNQYVIEETPMSQIQALSENLHDANYGNSFKTLSTIFERENLSS